MREALWMMLLVSGNCACLLFIWLFVQDRKARRAARLDREMFRHLFHSELQHWMPPERPEGKDVRQ